MENKDLLNENKSDNSAVSENELPLPLYEAPKAPLTALEFEIAEDGDENQEAAFESEDKDIAESDLESVSEPENEEAEEESVKEEFLIPDKYKTDPTYDTQSFLSTPGALRPTYLPRFTEVSDTYRVKGDTRPRPNPVKKEVDEGVDTDTDPTSEKLEDRNIDKVLVTSGINPTKEAVDESITILKFSTPELPEEEEEQNVESVAEVEAVSLEQSPEVVDETLTEDEEISEDTVIEEDEVQEESEVEKPVGIPDPDLEFKREISVYNRENDIVIAPLGAEESADKDKKSKEYTAPIQRDSIKDRFLDTLMSIKVRLVCAAILLFTVIVMDCLRLFGVDPLESIGLGAVSSAKAYVDMQFAVCMFLFAIPESVMAIRLLFKKTCTPELLIPAMLPIVVANCLIIALNDAKTYMTFVLLFGLHCFFAIVASYIKTDADFIAFKSVSKNIGKNVLDKQYTRVLPRENLALDGAIDEYNSKTARMFRTVFVSGFFKRSKVNCENSTNILMMLGISAGLSLVAGFVSFFLNGFSLVSGSQTFTMVLMLSLPVFSVLVHKLPYRISAKTAEKFDEGAYVGESSLYESADVDVVTYEDTEIFGIEDVKVRVHVYGNIANTPKAVKQMYSLFTVVGGPLEYAFASVLDRKCAPATDIIIEDDGISGTMEGHRVHAGTEEYMLRHGINIPGGGRKNAGSSDSNRIMYGAEDNEVYAWFSVRYSFSEEFTMLLPELKEKKIIPLIYTRDPNITAELLKMLTLGEDIIRVMKKYVPRSEEENTYRRIDSGLVTYGDKLNAINMVLLAKKYTALQSAFSVMELITMIIGAAIAVVVSIGEIIAVPECAFAIWQLVWCLVLVIRSKLTLKGNSIRYDDEGKRTGEE